MRAYPANAKNRNPAARRMSGTDASTGVSRSQSAAGLDQPATTTALRTTTETSRSPFVIVAVRVIPPALITAIATTASTPARRGCAGHR